MNHFLEAIKPELVQEPILVLVAHSLQELLQVVLHLFPVLLDRQHQISKDTLSLPEPLPQLKRLLKLLVLKLTLLKHSLPLKAYRLQKCKLIFNVQLDLLQRRTITTLLLVCVAAPSSRTTSSIGTVPERPTCSTLLLIPDQRRFTEALPLQRLPYGLSRARARDIY